jgi:hypothetical protein
MRAGTWLPLKVDGSWNPTIRVAFDRQSGAYAFRDRTTGTVLYVGESHCDRGWRTMLRHFQDPSGKFAKLGEWTHRAPERLEAAIWPTSRGDAATKKEHALIQRLKPTGNQNTTEIRAAECKTDTDFDFGANVKNPTPVRGTSRPAAPRPIGMRPAEVDDAPAAYDAGYYDAIMLRASSLHQGMSNAWIKYPGGVTRATAYVWGFWHAIASGATKARARHTNPSASSSSSRASSATDYKATHGELEGDYDRKRAHVPDPRAGALVVLGTLKRVEYITDKGQGESVYHHDFGREFTGSREHGRVKPSRRPVLAFNRDGLVIAGGRYRVEPEGIVG